jgi:CDP-4-dehydro-6-deoxyglucose reductase
MTHQMSVWRAAQLLGVARGVLQQLVRDGVLTLNDGLISTDALLRLYPDARFEESGLLEQVTHIREAAFGKRLRERLLPNQEVLSQRLFAQSQELADVRKHLQHYHALVIRLQTFAREQVQSQPADVVWRELEHTVSRGLAMALATESSDVLAVMDDMLKVMTSHVTVRPSGNEFLVEGHANLLQSGLQAGLKLNYGCGNGSCGMCKVRVISGEVAKTQASDYQLSETEKAQGYTLMCCNTASSSELTLELLEARGPQDIPEQNIVTQVRAATPLGTDTMLLHLQTPRSHRLRFLAGQSVQLGFDMPGEGSTQLTQSIGSCPCDDRNLLFYISRNPQDAFARHLFASNIRAGSKINVRGPVGEFVLIESSRPLVFAACDGGISPIKSLVEHALAQDSNPKLSLYWLVTGPDGHFLENHCRAWSEALDQFEYELVTQSDAGDGARDIACAMRADLFGLDSDFYLAGPEAFVQVLFVELRAAGVIETRIRAEVI